MSYLDYRRKVYDDLVSKIDKGMDVESLRKDLVQEIKRLEYLKEHK